MTKTNTINSSSSNLKYYFIAAVVATAIAGIIHIYMPLAHPHRMLNNIPFATFFLGSGLDQLFWIIPMIRRWGDVWYYVGIAGNISRLSYYTCNKVSRKSCEWKRRRR